MNQPQVARMTQIRVFVECNSRSGKVTRRIEQPSQTRYCSKNHLRQKNCGRQWLRINLGFGFGVDGPFDAGIRLVIIIPAAPP
jgi:hypothetical protein